MNTPGKWASTGEENVGESLEESTERWRPQKELVLKRGLPEETLDCRLEKSDCTPDSSESTFEYVRNAKRAT